MSKYRTYYRRRKAELRDQAIEYSCTCANGEVLYWSDLVEMTDYFAYWGKRFGLIREFKENGII